MSSFEEVAVRNYTIRLIGGIVGGTFATMVGIILIILAFTKNIVILVPGIIISILGPLVIYLNIHMLNKKNRED